MKTFLGAVLLAVAVFGFRGKLFPWLMAVGLVLVVLTAFVGEKANPPKSKRP